MQPTSLPVLRGIYLCKTLEKSAQGGVTLTNLFNTDHFLRQTSLTFVVFSQWSDGFGEVPVHVDILDAAAGTVVHRTNTFTMQFTSRSQIVYMAVKIERCRFPRPGLYVVEVYANNSFAADTTLILR